MINISPIIVRLNEIFFYVSRCLIMIVLGTLSLTFLTKFHPTEGGYGVNLAISMFKKRSAPMSY